MSMFTGLMEEVAMKIEETSGEFNLLMTEELDEMDNTFDQLITPELDTPAPAAEVETDDSILAAAAAEVADDAIEDAALDGEANDDSILDIDPDDEGSDDEDGDESIMSGLDSGLDAGLGSDSDIDDDDDDEIIDNLGAEMGDLDSNDLLDGAFKDGDSLILDDQIGDLGDAVDDIEDMIEGIISDLDNDGGEPMNEGVVKKMKEKYEKNVKKGQDEFAKTMGKDKWDDLTPAEQELYWMKLQQVQQVMMQNIVNQNKANI